MLKKTFRLPCQLTLKSKLYASITFFLMSYISYGCVFSERDEAMLPI